MRTTGAREASDTRHAPQDVAGGKTSRCGSARSLEFIVLSSNRNQYSPAAPSWHSHEKLGAKPSKTFRLRWRNLSFVQGYRKLPGEPSVVNTIDWNIELE